MIDPKRLTEADKGREVVMVDGSEHHNGTIQDWTDFVIRVDCRNCGQWATVLPTEADFASGTYQDGGQE